MKRLFNIISILCAAAAFGGYEAVEIPAGGQDIRAAGKIVRIEVASTVAAGKATVKRVTPLVAVQNVIDTYAKTNVTYTLVYTNGADVVTNVSPYIQRHFGAGFVSYATNRVVTAWAVTNALPVAVSAVTNNVASEITCSGGIGGADATDKWVLPGDRLIYSGTAKGVFVIIER